MAGAGTLDRMTDHSPTGAQRRAQGLAAHTPPATLLFDGDCGFCTAAARWLEARLRRGDGRDPGVVAWQGQDLDRLGVTAQRCAREVVWVGPESTQGGAAAFAAWLRHRGGVAGVLGRLLAWPVVRQVAALAYRSIARNRHRLPGGTPACVLDRPHGSE